MHPIPFHANAFPKARKLLYSLHSTKPSMIADLCAGLGLSSLQGLCAPQLRSGGGLDGLAGLADGGCAGNGVLAQVGAVAALGGAVDDGGVDPEQVISPILPIFNPCCAPAWGMFFKRAWRRRTCASPWRRRRWWSGSRWRGCGACLTS